MGLLTSTRAIVAAVGLGMAANPVFGVINGPDNPFPGTGGFISSTGTFNAGKGGGLKFNFGGYDFAGDGIAQAWWGPADIGFGHPVRLALDGSLGGAGESLVFSPGSSNLAGGMAMWTGSTRIFLNIGVRDLPTRYILQAMDTSNVAIPLVTAVSLGLAGLGLGALVPIPEAGFTASIRSEVKNPFTGMWMPSLDFFDAANDVSPSSHISSYSWGNYVEPVPAPGAAVLAMIGVGMTQRLRRRIGRV